MPISDFRMQRAGSKGFTLVELLVSVVILSVGIVAILHAIERSLFALGSARDHIWSDVLIEQKLTEMRMDAALADLPPDSAGDDFDIPYDDFSWETIVDDVSIAENQEGVTNRLYAVEMRVWRRGVEREFSGLTFISSR